MAMVNNIWPVRLYSNPATLITTIDGSSTGSTPLRKRAGYMDTYVPHVMAGVDKLHKEGFTGDGLFIGIVDTGVDYNHPALGGGFGPGHKVVTGYDLVGDAYNGTTDTTPVPDPDPMDCRGHGTHVSGIIGALPNPYNFTGVAPNATLGMWKVFGCTGQVGNDILIAAFNMAYEAGVDLISTSIGGKSGWTEDPWDVAVQRIAEKGVPCIIAAGNDGANGLFDTSTAAESIGATSVGSIDSLTELRLEIEATYLLNSGNSTNFRYSKGKFGDFGTISVPMYALTLNPSVIGDGCNPLPTTTPDLSPYVVLIRRGQCTFDAKIANAQAYGAKRILFYNNIPGVPAAPGDSSLTFPVGMVADTQGVEWISKLKAEMTIIVDFVAEKDAKTVFVSQPNVITGGKMSTLTSWGPSYEGWIKPQISAPGGNILSTLPLAQGGYGVESGTSMAAPFISGVVALIKQIRGKSALSPPQLTSVLATTAAPVDYNDGHTTYNYLAPIVQQGGQYFPF
jgi:subtilisin family serine protease